MHRMLACLVALALCTTAGAHFVFIVPDKDGSSARVVFSDDLGPDENVPVSKIAATKLTLRAGDGKPAALDWKKGDHCYDLKLSGKGFRVIQGTTEYGVLTKGKDKKETFLLRYHPRAVVGVPAEPMKPDAGLPVEIIPVFQKGKLRLLVAAKGKPLADAEVNVILPDNKKQKAKTDAKGLTDAFEEAGRYGAYVLQSEDKSGERDGKKYDQIRTYATLVVNLPSAK
jgi:uncharacterized GH25 family protein